MKVSELSGAALDYWVAKAEGFPQCGLHTEDGETVCFLGPVAMERFTWAPSTAWEQGGPIIERERISVVNWAPDLWTAGWKRTGPHSLAVFEVPNGGGPTALIAAMRAFVASKFGEEVPDL